MERVPIFKVGDKVQVVKFGSLFWFAKKNKAPKPKDPLYGQDSDYYYYDSNAKLIGQTGIIDGISMTQGKPHYSIEGIPEKHLWYVEKQLTKI